MKRELKRRIKRLSLYPSEDELRQIVVKEVEKKTSEFDVFVSVVHKDKWWTANITIGNKSTLERDARLALQNGEKAIKANWPNQIGKIVRKDGEGYLCGIFWLPLRSRLFGTLKAKFDEIITMS